MIFPPAVPFELFQDIYGDYVQQKGNDYSEKEKHYRLQVFFVQHQAEVKQFEDDPRVFENDGGRQMRSNSFDTGRLLISIGRKFRS